ncbi:MAG: hypoxanthine phosphoribosyltransferase [Bacteroidales bacterium]|nr:hypoxanthine phosphoribosyltransferase [Bacteroidales bacterium]
MKVLDKNFKPYMSQNEIADIVANVAKKINNDLRDKNPLFLSVLNGSFMFAADLLRALDFDAQISFVKMSSYSGTDTTGNVKQLIGLNEDLTGRTVVIIEDIVDTGISMEKILALLKEKNPAEVRVCTFFFKPGKFQKDFKIDYVGKSIADDFIVGYGLDYDGYGRNLNGIYVIDNQ